LSLLGHIAEGMLRGEKRSIGLKGIIRAVEMRDKFGQ